MPTDRTTVLVDRYRKAAATAADANAYKGLRIHALPGLHEFVAGKSLEYFPAGATVLDLAAGSGALSLRLQDLGFAVTATDYVPENFRPRTIPFVQADLNADFAAAYDNRFQAIVASEIIEHLENPRHFARQCDRLLAPGGRMVLTTPNIENAGSKASFLRCGRFLWFEKADYVGHGHITPLTQWQIHDAFTEAGLRFLWRGSFGAGASQLAGSPRLRLLARLVALLSALPRELGGEIYVAVLEKPSRSQAAVTAPPAATGR